MNGIAHFAGPRTLILALAFGLSLFSSGVAAAPISYATHGNLWPWQYGDAGEPGIQGENVISFIGVPIGTFTDVSSNFSLGQFQLAPLPPGEITYYDNTGFTIVMNTTWGGNVVPTNPSQVPYSSIRLSGSLFGAVIGADTSGVVAMIRSVEPNSPNLYSGSPDQPILDLPFDIASLDVSRPTLLNPASRNGGRTTISTVPEPTTIALFLVTFGGLGLRRRIRAGRNA